MAQSTGTNDVGKIRFVLGPQQVHVFHADLSYVATVLDDRHVPLTADERVRAERFRFATHRIQFEARRRLLRLLTARYLQAPAACVTFETGSNGKPHVAAGTDLQFSMSHSDFRVMYAFTRQRRVGVDLEQIRDGMDASQVSRLFCPSEREYLAEQSEPDRLAAFYRIWTRKEAFVKAVGCGLTIPLTAFAVSLHTDEGPALSWSSVFSGDMRRWSMFAAAPCQNYLAATVVEQPSTRPATTELLAEDVEALL